MKDNDSPIWQCIEMLIKHARYSFADINWNFACLTGGEKIIFKNQEALDKLKAFCDLNSTEA